MFAKLSIKKDMPTKELLGIKLRDDLFLQMMAESKEEIRQIWIEQIGEDPFENECVNGDDVEVTYEQSKDLELKRQELENKLQSLNDALTVKSNVTNETGKQSRSLAMQRSLTELNIKNKMQKAKSHVKFMIDQTNDSICIQDHDTSKISKMSKVSSFKRRNTLFKTTPAPLDFIFNNNSQKSLAIKQPRKSTDDISSDPFYLKLCLMNARIKVFKECFYKKTEVFKKSFLER